MANLVNSTRAREHHTTIHREALAALDRIMSGLEATRALQPVRIRRPRGRNGRVSSAPTLLDRQDYWYLYD